MNRGHFQQLADLRIDEVTALLAQGKWDGAYYLAGYAVECGLKACIAKRTGQYGYPPKPRLIHDYYSHDIDRLVRTAELTAPRDIDATADPLLEPNWDCVKDWNEESRYERKTQAEAQQLIAAITEAAHGVLPWIKRHW